MKILSVFLILISISHLQASAPEWKELILWNPSATSMYTVSSALHSVNNDLINGKYGAKNLFDQTFSTAWVEGRKDEGVHETIFTIIPKNCKTLNIFGGYGKNHTLYDRNNRLKKIKLSLLVGINPQGHISENTIVYRTLPYEKVFSYTLKDTFSVQTIPLSFDLNKLAAFTRKTIDQFKKDFKEKIGSTATLLKIEIEAVYRGSRWNDTCVSELFFNNLYLHNPLNEIYGKIDSVYVNKDENTLLMDTPQKYGIILHHDSHAVFQIVEISTDKQWLNVIRMPAEGGQGRLESEYLIFNTHLKKEMTRAISRVAGGRINGPFYFNRKNGHLFLEYYLIGQDKTSQIELK